MADASDCYWEIANDISVATYTSGAGTFGAGIASGAPLAALNAAVAYTDGWAVSTSFNFPKAFTTGSASCPGAGGVSTGLCLYQGSN